MATPSFGKTDEVVLSGFTVLTSTNDQAPSIDNLFFVVKLEITANKTNERIVIGKMMDFAFIL
jgi:hypothetical protein